MCTVNVRLLSCVPKTWTWRRSSRLDLVSKLQGIDQMIHPPYNLDLTLCDFWLFPALKIALHGRHFQTDAKVLQVVDTFFQSLTPDNFHKSFHSKWEESMDCVWKPMGDISKKSRPKMWPLIPNKELLICLEFHFLTGVPVTHFS